MIFKIIRSRLDGYPIVHVKLLAKRYNIKGYYKLKKNDIIEGILRQIAVSKIQRFTRKKLSLNDVCPLTLDTVKYPLWGKKTHNGFIYYNLEDLANYIVSTGNFKDPSTRIKYSQKEIDEIDRLVRQMKVKLPKNLKTAQMSAKYYRRQKEKDEQIDILVERIRALSWLIRDKVEEVLVGEDTLMNLYIDLNNVYFPDISHCMKLLDGKCKNSLKNVIMDSKKVVDDISIDCDIVKKVKGCFSSWLIREKSTYGFDDLEI